MAIKEKKRDANSHQPHGEFTMLNIDSHDHVDSFPKLTHHTIYFSLFSFNKVSYE